jgi:hypothetical protein
MLTISKALSAGQARTYHAREFVSEKQNYWSRDAQVHSEWQGQLAKEWGLGDSVGAEEFARLSEGQHPESGAQLVKHQPAKPTTTSTARKSPASNIEPGGTRHSQRRNPFLSPRLSAVMQMCAKRTVRASA